MAGKRKPKLENKEQSRRFVETARKLEADESNKAFERVVKSLISPRPKVAHARPSGKRSSS